jgi:hypothetical protein
MAIITYNLATSGTHFFSAAFRTLHLLTFIIFKGNNYADTKGDSAY